MPRPTSLSPLARIVRVARPWLLWLALALAAAHSAAVWHGYTHEPAAPVQSSQDHKHAGSAACGLCIAIAGIGGAPGHAAACLVPDLGCAPPGPAAAVTPPAGPDRPYAIRAPPLLRS